MKFIGLTVLDLFGFVLKKFKETAITSYISMEVNKEIVSIFSLSIFVDLNFFLEIVIGSS